MGFNSGESVDNDAPQFIVRTWDKRMHIKIITLIVIMTLISGFLLEKYTNAILPFIDGLTTWGAIVATYMVAKRLLENWIYWFVIDFISIFLFMSRGLFLTSGLFFIYLVIIYFGYMSWVKIRDEILVQNLHKNLVLKNHNLEIIKTIKSGPVSEISICNFDNIKAILRIDYPCASEINVDRKNEIFTLSQLKILEQYARSFI